MIRTPIRQAFRSIPTSPFRTSLQGLTLLEMLIVVVVLVTLGLQAMPRLDSVDENHLNLAATKIAAAMRYARDESIRSGVVHSVELDTTDQVVRVVQYDDFDDVGGSTPLVPHPLSRQPYEIDLSADVELRPARLASPTINYAGTTSPDRIDFDVDGAPHYNRPGGTRHRLLDAQVEVVLGGMKLPIAIQPFTGRVVLDLLAGPQLVVVGPGD